MKKILLTSLLAFSAISVNAQIFFTDLIAQEVQSNIAEHPNYSISNKFTSAGWVLDTKWWGGINFTTQGSIKLKSLWGTLYVANTGAIGINTEDPQHTLDVRGDFKVSSNSNYFFYNGAGDLKLSYQARGTGGRAVVHDTGNTLSLNYENDFSGGTRIGNTFLVKDNNASLQGKFEAKEIKVTLTPTADFVFAEDYDLPKLEDVEKHIKEKKHLPEIASAKQMEKEGVNVGEFQIKLLQKIEELILYTIEQNKKIKELSLYTAKQNQRIQELESKISKN